jgi:hypothetical protein
MRKIFSTVRQALPIAVATFALLGLLGASAQRSSIDLSRLFVTSANAQGGLFTTALPNYKYTAMSFTATSQNKTQAIGGVSTASVQISGSSLTTVTWQLTCSNDGGANYYGIPSLAAGGTVTSGVLPITTAGTITTTTAALYYFNLSGCTNFKIATSGTFTATSVTAQVVASSNKGLL